MLHIWLKTGHYCLLLSCLDVVLWSPSENNLISVWNNGKGIPVVQHKVEKVFVPALIFGQLLTSSNYDDDQKKVTGMVNTNPTLYNKLNIVCFRT